MSSGERIQTKNTPLSEGASEILRFCKYRKTQPGEELLWVLAMKDVTGVKYVSASLDDMVV